MREDAPREDRSTRAGPDPRSEEIPFHVPSVGEEEIQAVAETIRSGWLTTGPRVREFESRFAEYVGVERAVAVSSGTAALHLGLRGAGIGEGDEVVTTPYTFVATVEAILCAGANPVFVDVDPRTLNIDPEAVAVAVTPRTRAILPVHVAGHPCDMTAILRVANRHGLAVIEDAAHALPSEVEGRRIGTIGTATAFSFYATKNLTTGEGGMITTADGPFADRLRLLALHGIQQDAWGRSANGRRWFYEVVEQGYKSNLSDIQAALGVAQLAKLDRMTATRRLHEGLYRRALQDAPLVLPAEEDAQYRRALHLFIIRIDPARTSWTREALIEALGARGIFASVHFIPLHLHPYYRRMGYRRGMFPRAEEAFDRALSLPFYPAMPGASVTRLLDTLCRLLEKESPSKSARAASHEP